MDELKIFDKWSAKGVEVKDAGLQKYINLQPVIVPRSGGKYSKHQFHKSKMSIVERFMNKLMVPGHRSKKHVLSSGHCVGKSALHYNIAKSVFENIEKKTGKNPIEVFVRAIENSAVREEITSYQVGGIMVRRAVITSPQRRVDKSLTMITQAAYRKSFGKKADVISALTDEIIAAYNNDASKSEAVKDKERIERESEGAR
jgi:small subunit ribosomal protein S7